MKFTLKQLFSIVDGRLSTEMGDVYKMLNHITNDNLFTHHLPVAMDYVKKVNPDWYVELTEKINRIKKKHGDDFKTLMKVIEKDKTEYNIPQLTKEQLSGFGEYMVENSLLIKFAEKKSA